MQKKGVKIENPMFARLLKLTLALVSSACSKIVIVKYKQQVVVVDQTPKINASIQFKNEGQQNVPDFQLIVPNDKLSLISHIDVEDGFGNPIKYQITDS